MTCRQQGGAPAPAQHPETPAASSWGWSSAEGIANRIAVLRAVWPLLENAVEASSQLKLSSARHPLRVLHGSDTWQTCYADHLGRLQSLTCSMLRDWEMRSCDTRPPLLCSMDDWPREDRVLWVDCTAMSAPCCIAEAGNPGHKPRCAPWASSMMSGTSWLWQTAARPAERNMDGDHPRKVWWAEQAEYAYCTARG